MKKICFPTDFSEASGKTWPIALELTQKLGAELHVIHVMNQDVDLAVGKKSLADMHQKAVEGKFHEFKSQLPPEIDSAKIHMTSLRGDVVKKINNYCSHEGIDLLIMSTHGYSGLKRIFMGSTTYKLLQASQIPVLALNPKSAEDFHIQKVKNICFPTDFSDLAHESMDYAIHLAETFEANLTLFHALTDYREWIGVYGDGYSLVGNYGSYQGFLTEQKELAQDKLEALKKNILKKKPDLEVSVNVAEGPVDKALEDYCEYNFETIIVMSTHGYSGLDRFLMGSVAERVVQSAMEPVMVINPMAQKIAKEEQKKDSQKQAVEGEPHASL